MISFIIGVVVGFGIGLVSTILIFSNAYLDSLIFKRS